MKDNYFVRPLEAGDIDEILPLAMKSWKYTYKGIYEDGFIENYVNRAYRRESLTSIKDQSIKGLTLFVVLVEQATNSIKGFAQVGYDRFWEHKDKNLTIRLFRIYLDPKILGQGLGKLLLEQIEEFVRQTGKDRYIVGVHEKNVIGLKFYEKQGFKAISTTSDAEGEIFFEKILN